MSVTGDPIRIHAMKIYCLLSILIILLTVSTSHQRSLGDYSIEEESLATPWSVQIRHREMRDKGWRQRETEQSEQSEEAELEATPWP